MNPLSALTTTHYRAAALLWTVGIVVACLLPASSLSSVQPAVGVDKLVHVVLFAGFGGLWMRALCPPAQAADAAVLGRWTLGVLVVGAGVAVGTEVLQQVAPVRRMGDPYDVLANLLGLGIAAGGYRYAVRREDGPSVERSS
jgi:hypothetical protein